MYIIYLILVVCLAGCELIRISAPKRIVAKKVNITQESAEDSILVLRNELDSNNFYGAAELFIKPNKEKYLAVDRAELYDEMCRYSRIFSDRPNTGIKLDTIDKSNINIKYEVSFKYNYKFNSYKLDSLWYLMKSNLN